MKVVVVDDSQVMRKIIANVVESLGYECMHATNGQHLLDLLEQPGNEIGLVLLDWNMPVLNGGEVLKLMQENSRLLSIPVFMISTESEDTKIADALRMGAKGYLSKPFTADQLEEKIKVFLKKPGGE